jgi:hypothetical protein
VRLVAIPATPLLVRVAAGRADPVAALREVVRDVLRDVLRDVVSDGAERVPDGVVVVLGTGPTTRTGRLRPTLAAAGIADAQLPIDVRQPVLVPSPAGPGAPEVAWEGVASTGPSVALLALADAGLDIVARPVDVVEVSGDASDAQVAAAVRRMRGDGSGERLLVVADHPAAGVDAVLAVLLGAGSWTREVHEVPMRHDHLPASYRVTVHRTVGP